MRAALTLSLAIILAAGTAFSAPAQEPPSAAELRQEEGLRVFIDCPDYFCDLDFFRTEINWISHVRERQDAQVHLLVTTQRTGAGGSSFTLNFIGQRDFRGVEDTLRYLTHPDDSEDQIRRGLVQVIKRGLVRYVNQTPFAERLEISYAAPRAQEVAPSPARDPWNYWTFRTSLNGYFSGEQAFGDGNLSASLSANRITQDWKITTSLHTHYNESRFELGEGRTLTNIQRNHGLNLLVVRSMGPQWSAGGRATLTSSTFLNQELALRLAPALEYNLFPYAESTRRQLTFQYSVGANSFDYTEETIFGRMGETLMDHRLSASVDIKQPWGSITTALEGGHYLHDLSKQRGVLFTHLDLRLFRGFSLFTAGNVELVRDQIHLPRRGASQEEILLRQRQLATSYRYSVSVGLGYTFGSPFANVVNPRFGGTGGGFVMIH